MKKSIILFLLVVIFFPANAQTTADGSMPQFLFQEFTMGSVRMKNGQVQNSILNYNIVTEKMVYENGKDLYDITNAELIDTVYVQKSKFVPSGKVFFEVLLEAPVSLFVQHTGSVAPPGAPAGYGGTSQVSSTKQLSGVELSTGYYNLKLPKDFKVQINPVYWIRAGKEYSSFINERQFLKLFPDKEEELKKYIKDSKIKFSRQSDIVKLTWYYNEIIK
ncbi:MAG: hypothetical protein IPJ16_14085 [Bacteroidales bacterium]|nr:hypothetical protein [Bacteroidales bacterium]